MPGLDHVSYVTGSGHRRASESTAGHGKPQLNLGLIVGGSIVIPHLRRAVELLDELGDDDAATDTSEG